MGNIKVVEGSEAVALAVKACRPHVISAYPISPQTHIVEGLGKMAADGDIDAEYVRVESEFSAASVLAGAAAACSRSYTASSSQGLLLMTEVLYASAGMRLPFVITGVNRSVSAPINIQVDHQDSMSLRDAGLIQFYVESVQEAYDMHLAAFKIAEDPKIMLPVMVCMDGWVLTHSYERVAFVEMKRFSCPMIGELFFTSPHTGELSCCSLVLTNMHVRSLSRCAMRTEMSCWLGRFRRNLRRSTLSSSNSLVRGFKTEMNSSRSLKSVASMIG